MARRQPVRLHSKFHEPSAIAVTGGNFGGNLNCQSGLTDSSDARERYQPRVMKQGRHLRKLVVATKKTRCLCRQVAWQEVKRPQWRKGFSEAIALDLV
jgi:hypothetical protein